MPRPLELTVRRETDTGTLYTVMWRVLNQRAVEAQREAPLAVCLAMGLGAFLEE